jgi:hypothetical protein
MRNALPFIILALFVGLVAGAVLATYERKWECDSLGHWRTTSFAYECHRIPDPTSEPK